MVAMFFKMATKNVAMVLSSKNDIIEILDPKSLSSGTRIMTIHQFLYMYTIMYCGGHVFQNGRLNIGFGVSILSKMSSLESLTLKTYNWAPESWQYNF